MRTRRSLRISPVRETIHCIKEQQASSNHNDQTDNLQSFVLRVVLKTAAMKNIVLTPAPTAASVNPTSTAPISAHSKHIRKLNVPKMIDALIKSFALMDAMAVIATKISIIRSNCQIIFIFPPLRRSCERRNPEKSDENPTYPLVAWEFVFPSGGDT